MRLTIVNQYYPPDISPTARLAASLAEHRAAKGDEVTVLTSRSRYAGGRIEHLPDQPLSENPRVIRTSSSSWKADRIWKRAWQYLLFYLGAIWRIGRLPRQDVVICLTTPPYIGFVGWWHARRESNSYLILWSMDTYPDILESVRMIRAGGILARFGRWLTRQLAGRADALVCLDQAMADRYRSQYVSRSIPIHVIPNWESLNEFPDRTDQCLSTDRGDRLFTILYMGNAGFGHEFETVLDAAEKLRNSPVLFRFVGGGSKHRLLRGEMERRQLTNLQLGPYVSEEEKSDVLIGADLALVTLDDSACGLMSPSKLHAYLGMSLPVIYVGPRQTNVDHAIERYECGVSLRHGQVAELVEFVHRLRTDTNVHVSYRRRARRAFEYSYCDQVTLPQLDRLIEQIAGLPDSQLHHNESSAVSNLP